MTEKIVLKGKEGEVELNMWFQNHGLSYVAVCQSPDTFSPLFGTSVKRPDFLLLLESIGLIAVDAKNYTLSKGVFTLPKELEWRRSMTFERLFRIPIWYAYMADDKKSWYWISALKAIEVGEVRKNKKTGEEFLAIKLEQFEVITTNEDLGKLYTHRLKSTTKLQQ